MTDEKTYDQRKKVYKAGNHLYSIVDLLGSAVSADYLVNGMTRVSDFHLKTGEPVRYRLDDTLQIIPGGEAMTPEAIEDMIFPLLNAEQIDRLRRNPRADVDAAYALPGGDYFFRVNVFRDRNGLAAVIRLLPPNVPPVEEIGFPYGMVWQSVVEAKQGLVLVTGVTGSGKSTTIASILNRINDMRGLRIVTLEDPIEFVFTSNKSMFSQREIGHHVTSFAAGLRSALRENPDVIYVGEIRDQETASLVLSAAETGHLVLATMHSRDATGALTRLMDMFPAEREKELSVQLSFSLTYVLSQKLVQRADGTGRCVAMEVLRNNSAISNMVRTGNWQQLYGAIETRSKEGMCTMEQSLVWLFDKGMITKDEAISHANEASIVERLDAIAAAKRR